MSRLLGRKARHKKMHAESSGAPYDLGRKSFLRGDPRPSIGSDQGKQRAFYKGYRAAEMEAQKKGSKK